MRNQDLPDPNETKGQRARRRLILNAIELMSKEGLAGASFQKLADMSGMKQGSVFFHFEDKNDLIEAVILEVIRHNHEHIQKTVPVNARADLRLIGHFEETLNWAAGAMAHAQVLSMFYYMASFEPRFTAMYAKMLEVARDRILVILLAGEREGVFRFSVEPKRVAEMLHDCLLGGSINELTTDRRIKRRAEVKVKWRELIRLLVSARAPGQGRARKRPGAGGRPS